MKKFFGFALADRMFAGDCTIVRRSLDVEQAYEFVSRGVECCCNSSRQTIIDAIRNHYGIEVVIPTTPPRVKLSAGDSIVVMNVRGLPRLEDRHEYTHEEIAAATFTFTEYTVQ